MPLAAAEVSWEVPTMAIPAFFKLMSVASKPCCQETSVSYRAGFAELVDATKVSFCATSLFREDFGDVKSNLKKVNSVFTRERSR